MKKVIAKKVIITATWAVMILSLAGCGQQNTSKNVSWGTSIQEVNNWADNKITATWELKEKQSKTKWQNKQQGDNKTNHKKQMDEMKKQILSQLGDIKSKISKGKLTSNDIAELTNLYYNKQLLPKDKQAEVDKFYNKVKIAKIQQIIKQVKNSKIPNQYKQQIINALQKKMKDKNITIDELNMIAQNVKWIEIRYQNPKLSNRYVEWRKIELIKNIKTASTLSIDKQISSEVNTNIIKDIRFKNTNNIHVSPNKVEQYLLNKIKDIANRVGNIRTSKNGIYISLQDFNHIVSLAKDAKNVKIITKTIINPNYMWVADIPYVVYKGKPIDVNSVLYTLKTIKLLQSAWLANIVKNHLLLVKDNRSGLYFVRLDKGLEDSWLIKYAKHPGTETIFTDKRQFSGQHWTSKPQTGQSHSR